MAIVEPSIKLVRLSDGDHKIDASFLEGHTWAEVTDIASKSFNVAVYTTLPVLSTATDADFEKYRRTLALIEETGATGTYVEYVVVGDNKATAAWERIGTTQTDLTNYVKKDTTYTGAALSNGAHTHSVTINTVSKDGTKKLGATASGTTVGADGTDTFVKSYSGATSKLVTTTLKGVSGTTTVSKVTAGATVTVGKRAASATTVGNANVGAAVSIPNVTGNSSVNATNIATPAVKTIKEVNTVTAGTAAKFTQGSKASWSASVVDDGVLSFSWTSNGDDSFTANTPTAVTTTSTTGVVRSTASTPSATAVTASKVTLGTAISVTPAEASETTIYGVDGTATITPYTAEEVTVATANANATTVATGSLNASGGGATIMTGLGTATTASALTGVKVTAQPTVTITESETNTGPVNEHVTIGTTSATTDSQGAHTHNLKVTS